MIDNVSFLLFLFDLLSNPCSLIAPTKFSLVCALFIKHFLWWVPYFVHIYSMVTKEDTFDNFVGFLKSQWDKILLIKNKPKTKNVFLVIMKIWSIQLLFFFFGDISVAWFTCPFHGPKGWSNHNCMYFEVFSPYFGFVWNGNHAFALQNFHVCIHLLQVQQERIFKVKVVTLIPQVGNINTDDQINLDLIRSTMWRKI